LSGFVQFAYTGDYSIPKTEKRNITAKLEKAEMNTQAHPFSPSAPNGIRRRNTSHDSDEASIAELHDRSAPVFENELRQEPTPDKLDDNLGSSPTYPSSLNKRNKKKKKPKIVIKALSPESEPERTVPEPGLAMPEPEPAAPEPALAVPVLEPEPETAVPEVEADLAEQYSETEPTPFARREKYPEQLSHMLAADFHSLSYPLLAPRDNYDGTCEPAADFENDKSYSNVLLSHASLYVLGDFQIVDSLKALALFKLHKTLCAFQLDNENVGDITDLARYAYSEDGRGFDEGVGGLRGLVCQYMAIHAMELSLDTKFMNLLAEGGQIVKDFFKFQLQRAH